MSSRYLLGGMVPLTQSPFINNKHRTPRPTVDREAGALSVCPMTEERLKGRTDKEQKETGGKELEGRRNVTTSSRGPVVYCS